MRNLRLLFIAVVVLISLTGSQKSYAQAASTIAAGNWDNPAIWSGGAVPTSAFGAITVRHTVHVTAAAYPLVSPLTIDQTTIGANGFTGILIVDAGASVRLANGTGTDMIFAGTPTIGAMQVSGTFGVSQTAVLSGNTTANVNFLAGSTYEHRYTTGPGVLPTATYDIASTVLISSYTGNVTVTSTSWEVPLGNVIFNCPSMGTGTVDFGGHLSNVQGDFSIQNSGTTGRFIFKSANGSTGPATMTIGGDLSVSGTSRMFLATNATGIQLNVTGDFSFNPSVGSGTSQHSTTGTATLTVGGTITMTSGTWDFVSGTSGTGTFNLTGPSFNDTGGTLLTKTGTGTSVGSLNFSSALTAQTINVDPAAIGAGAINLVINNTSPAGTVTLSRNLTISGLSLQNGTLDINGLSLTVNGAVTQTAGTIVTATASTLIFGGTGTFPGTPINISPSASFTLFRLNRASQTLISSANFSVATLDLFAGTLNNTAGTPTITNTGVLNRQATTASATGVLQNTAGAAGTYSVNYTNIVALTTGAELPVTTTVLQDLNKAGAGALTVGQTVTVNGNLTISAGSFALGAGISMSLLGNLTTNSTTTFGNTASTFTFESGAPGTATVSGTTAPTFPGSLVVNDNVNVTINFRLNRNLTVNAGGTITATAGTVSFGGTTVVTNNGTINLNAVTILASSSLTAPSTTFGVRGNFTFTNNTSTFTHNSGTILFNGTSALLGTGTKVFSNISVASGSTLSSTLALRINGNISNSGTISFTAGTLTLGGNTTLTGSGATTFNIVAALTGSAFVAGANFTTTGAVALAGTASFTLNSTMTANAAVAINGTSVFTNNGTLQMSAGFAVAGTYAAAPSSITRFSGTTTMSGNGTKTMGNVVITGTLTPNAAYTIAGNLSLTGVGTLNAGNNTTTFGGTTLITNSGTGAIRFNILAVSGVGTLNSTANFFISGTTVTITGSFTSQATTTFSRAGTTALGGTGTLTFGNITINSGTTVTPNVAYTVNGNMLVNGTLSPGTGSAIFGGTSAITTAGTPTIGFNNITINATRTLTSFSGNITVNGNFTNNGTFNHNNGRVTFSGNTTKSITSATPTSITPFYNINVNNGTATPDLVVEMGVDLFSVLTLAINANVDADGVGNNRILTIRSTGDNPTVDASIAILPAGATITGNVTVQRYMAIEGAGNRIYRYISSPVLNPTASDIQNEIPITGTFTGASTCSGCSNNASMFWYNEAVLTGGIDGGYTGFPVASNTETLARGRGYALFVRGNINPVLGAGSARFDVRGPINSGTVNYTPTFTSSGTAANDGWNLVGNPYPATMDWNASSGWTKTNVAATIYTLDQGSNPTRVATWNGIVGTNGGSRYIAMGQGFFVQTTAASPALSSTESVKASGTQTIFFRTMQPVNLLRIALANGIVQDEAVIHFRDSASNEFDFEFDAIKMKNYNNGTTPYLNLSTMTHDGKRLAINSLPVGGCAAIIPLEIADVPAGTYQLNFSNLESFATGDVSLLDHFAGVTIDLRLQSLYSFQVTTDTHSFGAQRFELNFSGEELPTKLAVNSEDVCNGSDASVEVLHTLPNFHYFIQKNGSTIGSILSGNGGAITIPVIKDSLDLGENHLKVVAELRSCSSAKYEQDVSISVRSYDDAAITLVGSESLSSNFATGNHWYLDGNLLDDTTQILSIHQSGVYGLEVNIGSCTSSSERSVSLEVVTGVDDSPQAIRAFPNPVESVLSVELSSTNPATSGGIFNALGFPVGSMQFIDRGDRKRGEFDFSQQPGGFYYLHIGDGTNRQIIKIIRK